MLKIFRQKNVTKLVLWGLLILILPAFVLWGTGSIGRSKEKGPRYVGAIDKKNVSFEEFAGSLGGIRCQIILAYFNQPQALDALLRNRALLGKIAWDRLVMLAEAKKHNIKVADSEVINYIKSHPLFSRNGRFDDRLYEYFLKNNMGLDPRSFEEIARENLAIRKLQESLTKDLKVTDYEILEAYKADNDKFKISYIMVAADNFLDKVKVDDAAAKDYYDKHEDEFIIPTGVANFEDVSKSIKSFLAEGEARSLALKDAVEAHKKILGLMESDKLTFDKASAKLSLKVQETPFFTRSDYIEGIGETDRLADAALKLKAGEVSGPIETRKGALIFKLSDVQGFDEERFRKEKDEYAKKFLDRKKTSLMEGWLRDREAECVLNIDLKEYGKYYR